MLTGIKCIIGIMLPALKRRFILFILIVLILAGVAFAVKNFFFNKSQLVGENELEMLQWDRPKTDTEWAKGVLAEGLNFRFDYQLEEMLSSHSAKRDKLAEELQKYADCPECVRYEIKENLKADFFGVELEQKVIDMFNEQLSQRRKDYQVISRSVERIVKEIDLRKRAIVDRRSDLLQVTPSTEREREELKKLKSELK